tara:strand:- start:343 stop:534 length:192 start_codon:yes stop_codon:yes gene_type:complete
MNLRQVQLKLNWPQSIHLTNLRKFILDNISDNGEVIRWSISEIKCSDEEEKSKILIVNAVIIN